MNRQRLQFYEMLTRVSSCGKRNGSLFPNTSDAAEIFKAVESDVTTLAELSNTAISAETAMESNLNIKTEAREALKNALLRASRMCREFEIPQLYLPKNLTARVLVTLGRGFVADAAPIKGDFERHGLAIEEIDAAVRNLEAAVIGSANAKVARSTAVRNWDAAVKDALGRLHRLDLIAMNVLKENPIALAEYTAARAIPKPSGRKEEAPSKPSADPEAPAAAGPAPKADAAAA